MRTLTQTNKNEIVHFTNLEHIWWGAKTPAGQKRYDNKFEIFKKICKPMKKHTILEIGCGDGEFTKRLVNINSKIIATDLTPSVVAKGRKTIKRGNIKFMVDNAEKMQFKNKSFDVVCGVSILHHIDREKSLKEVFRVLKPRGQLFFTEPNLLNPHIFAGLHIKRLREKMEFSPDETALVRWMVNKLLKKIGFKKVSVINYDFLHPKTPKPLIKTMEKISSVLEKTPVIKEISGSLVIWAEK